MKKKSLTWIAAAVVAICALLAICFLHHTGNREFPMTGHNISNLDTEQILTGICKAEGLDDSSILYCNADNFDMMLTTEFDFDNSGAIRFSYEQNKKIFSAQLRLFLEDTQYFVTERSEWIDEKRHFLLREYLDALRFLPQKEIRLLSEDADAYSICIQPEGTPEDYERTVMSQSDGAGDADGWIIHLEILPLQNGYGSGDDVIHAFYEAVGDDK